MESWFRWWGRWRFRVDRLLLWTGVALLGLAGCFWLPRWLWSRSMQHAMGTVTEIEARQNAQGDVAYFPHFRFRLPNDEIVLVVGTTGSEEPSFSERQVVPVAYKAGNPQGAILAPTKQVYKTAIAFGITGTVVFDLGAVLWMQLRRREMRHVS